MYIEFIYIEESFDVFAYPGNQHNKPVRIEEHKGAPRPKRAKLNPTPKDFDPTEWYEWDYVFCLNNSDWRLWLNQHTYCGKTKISKEQMKDMMNVRCNHERYCEYLLTSIESLYLHEYSHHEEVYLPLIRDDFNIESKEFDDHYDVDPVFGGYKYEQEKFEDACYPLWVTQLKYDRPTQAKYLKTKFKKDSQLIVT